MSGRNLETFVINVWSRASHGENENKFIYFVFTSTRSAKVSQQKRQLVEAISFVTLNAQRNGHMVDGKELDRFRRKI